MLEYKIDSPSLTEAVTIMNKRAAEGWSLVSLFQDIAPNGMFKGFTAVWSRPISDEDDT